MKQSGLYKHYSNFYLTQNNDFRAYSLFKVIKTYLDKNVLVIDLGSGSCSLSLNLLKEGYKVLSVEPSSEMIDMAQNIAAFTKINNFQIIQSDIIEFSNNNTCKFNQIVCLDVIEHIKNDKKALQSIFSMLKPGGRLILSVPSISKLYGPKDIAVGHYRRYDLNPLVNKLRNIGFKLISFRYWNFIGVLITFFVTKLLKKQVDESFRYQKKGFRLFNKLLRFYFTFFENIIKPITGLTLILELQK